MGGLFGVVSRNDCMQDLFYGTDYHSHLGTRRGGLAVKNKEGIVRHIHSIETAPFRTKFEIDIPRMHGNKGIGIISDYEDQPLLIHSHLGHYALVTVGAVTNSDQLIKKAFAQKRIHFAEMKGGDVNPTELVASLINQEDTFEDGIRNVQESVQGSCSLLILTDSGIYAARDKWGRTPIAIGEKPGALCATSETCAFPNLNFTTRKFLGPGEIVFLSEEGVQPIKAPGAAMKICAFLWVYYGYPASTYEGINVEMVRNRCGAFLARRDNIKVDFVAGIPDSGTAHGLGYASEAGIPFKRPFVKYTPTWPRSFMPQNQETRNLVARMKLIPIQELITDKKLLFCEDSIVRGTQLSDTIRRIYDRGAKEIHMRPACPPLTYGCKFLNFSRSKSELDLAARMAVKELEGDENKNLEAYAREGSDQYQSMVDRICKRLHLTSLRYQKLDDLIEAIGLPAEKICTYCWTGKG